MIITALASLAIALTPMQAPAPITCAMLGSPAVPNGPAVDYKGVRYPFCCAMCQGGFSNNPDKAIKADRNKDKTIGVSLFDPVSMSRITDKQAKSWTDYHGVRYLFASNDEKSTFIVHTCEFLAHPAKEALYCPVEKEKIAGYDAAGSYRDYEGVRYYFCCGSCPAEFDKKPADYVKVASAYVMTPKAMNAPAAKVEAAPATGGGAPAAADKFTCKHCGKSMEINGDGSATCGVCRCGRTKEECKPGK